MAPELAEVLSPQEIADAYKLWTTYQLDPIAFQTQVLDVLPQNVWLKMREVAESVRNNPRTAVKAGHSVSKTYEAGRLALWFLLCFPPATVVTTAPTAQHVKQVLWREIRTAYTNAKSNLGGNLTSTMLDFQAETGVKWFAVGFSTRPDNVGEVASAFQGYHNENVLIIFDEACGIPPEIWAAAESLMASGNSKWLVTGNPTTPVGEFKDCFDSPLWNKITISCYDTPNYKEGREIIPGVAGRPYVQDMLEKYGEKSPIFKYRVLGEFPEAFEGSVYGEQMAVVEKESRIADLPIDKSYPVHTAWDIGTRHRTAIWFFQFINEWFNFIDYYEDTKEGVEFYAQVIKERQQHYGYLYGQHFGPHDLANEQFVTGEIIKQTAARLGLEYTIVPRIVDITQGIQASVSLLHKCRFDKNHCKAGIEHLKKYRWKLISYLSHEGQPVFTNTPVNDIHADAADAFRQAAQAYQLGLLTGIPSGLSRERLKEIKRKYARV